MASAAVVPAGKPNAQRPHAANVYKPAGVRHIQTGIPWVNGGSPVVRSKVRLTFSIRGFPLLVSWRPVIGHAAVDGSKTGGVVRLFSCSQHTRTKSLSN